MPRSSLARSGLRLDQWLEALPELAALVAEAVSALRDGRVTDDEALRLGRSLLALVGAVVHG